MSFNHVLFGLRLSVPSMTMSSMFCCEMKILRFKRTKFVVCVSTVGRLRRNIPGTSKTSQFRFDI